MTACKFATLTLIQMIKGVFHHIIHIITTNSYLLIHFQICLHRKLKALILDKIHCPFGIRTYITQDTTQYILEHFHKNLSLKSNTLETAVSNFFLPQNLIHLNMSDNKLTFWLYYFSISVLLNIESSGCT